MGRRDGKCDLRRGREREEERERGREKASKTRKSESTIGSVGLKCGVKVLSESIN